MAVFLFILKIIGRILVVLLIVILALILLLLFFPFTYRGSLEKKGDKIHAEGRIWWLFHAIHASGHFDRISGRTDKSGELYIFGYPLLSRLKKKKQKKPPVTENKISDSEKRRSSERPAGRKADGSARKKPTVEPGQWKYMPDEGGSGKKPDVSVYHRKQPGILEKISARLAAFIGKIKKALRSFGKTLKKIKRWLDYLASAGFQKLKALLIREVSAILRHILPRKSEGYIIFGTGDPASTGELLGAVAVFSGFIPDGVSVQPDFNEEKLEADVKVSGHFFLIVLLIHALKILLNREFKELRRRIKAEKQGKNPDSENEENGKRRKNGTDIKREKESNAA
ncbi:MAG: DUF2953 domain-containing protein [Eubacteriales bacterium]|jgi:energy-coupling factor transporter transmembrane protein EcfT